MLQVMWYVGNYGWCYIGIPTRSISAPFLLFAIELQICTIMRINSFNLIELVMLYVLINTIEGC